MSKGLRRSARLDNKQVNYFATSDHQDVVYQEVLPKHSVVKMKYPSDAQAKFPYLHVIHVDGEQKNVIFTGPIWEILERPAFKVRHIDHSELLKNGQVKYRYLPGSVCLRGVELISLTMKDFEIFLLRNLIQEQQEKIDVKLHLIIYRISCILYINFRN